IRMGQRSSPHLTPRSLARGVPTKLAYVPSFWIQTYLRLGPRQVPAVSAVPAPVELSRTRSACPSPEARPTDLHLPAGARPPAEMTSLPTTPSPG
ncbi:hypothetical protein EI555_004514, partial [Monodon monoceros]